MAWTRLRQNPIRLKSIAVCMSFSLAYSQEHIFERLSVAREHEVLTEALRHGRGKVELSDLQGSLSIERAGRALISSRDEIRQHASLHVSVT